MIYEQEHSIFDKSSLQKKFAAADTKFEVTNGKISSIISDSEISQYADEHQTVFSRLNSRMETVEGYEQQISSLKTTVEDDGKTISNMVSQISTLTQTDNEIKASVSKATKEINKDITDLGDQLDGVKDRVETAELAIKPDAIYSTVKKAESWTSDRQGDIDAAVGEAQRWTKSSESGIMQTADAIDMFVQESDVNGNYVISKINLDSTSAKIQARNINLQGAVSISDFDTSTQKLVNSHDMRFFTTAYQWDQAGIDNVANIGHVTTWTVKESIDDVMVGNTVIIQIYNKTKKIDSYLMAEVTEVVSVGNKQIKCSCIGLLERGLDGLKGDTGVGVDKITNYYLATDDGENVTRSTSGWTTTIQTITADKKFLWNYEVTLYTDGSTVPSDPHIIGVFGNDGVDGKGIKQIQEYYALTTDISEPPESSFSTEVKTVTAVNKYLWNFEKITYTDDSVVQTDKHIIGVYGDKGDKGDKGDAGVGVSSTEDFYLASTEEKGVTTSTSGWSKDPSGQTLTNEKKYLWNYETTTYTDGSKKNSTPHIISMFAKDGVVGKDGVSITEVKEFFARSTGTSASTIIETFTNTALQLTSTYKYLWNYEVVYFSDGTSKSNESKKRIIGVYGDKGANGVSIASITNYYLASSSASGVTRSTSGWKTDPSTQTLTETKKYLWNYEDNLMTDDSHKYVEPRIISTYAKNGVSVTKVEEYFARSTDNTESSIMESFGTKALKVTPVYKYLWNYEVVYFSDGTSTSNESKKRIIGVYGDTGAAGKDGAAGMSVKSSTPEYYLSWRVEDPSGGSWQTTPPAWKSGWVYWERVHTVLEGPSGTTDIYSTPVLSQGLNKACADANSAAVTLAGWAHKNNTTLIDGSNIYTGTIGAIQIASKAITADKIEADAIDASKIKTDALVGKILYATNYGDTTFWNPTIYYRNSQKKDANDREALWDNSDWTTSIPAYKSSVPYLWAYARINASSKRKNWTIPICIGYRTSSGIQYYTNLAITNGKIWSYTNENYLSLDGRAADSAANDRAFLASPDGYVSVSKEKGSAVHHAVDIYTSGCISMQGGDKVFITAVGGDLRLTPGDGRYVAIYGKMTATDNKSRLVQDTLYGDRLQYSYETPTPMFGDVGLGQLDENGEATIAIDDIFNETVNTSVEYAVFLQKEGPGDVWIDEKTELYFTVKGTPGLKFAWELKAVQKGYEQDRLNDFALEDNEPIDDTTLTRTLNEDLDNSLKEVDNLSSDLDKEMEELLDAETSVESISGD